ncbi:hypothetical protein OAG51_01205 [Pirellulaceae bacterium]|nr:hypothetical protein [Pirellulaceae bacterium]
MSIRYSNNIPVGREFWIESSPLCHAISSYLPGWQSTINLIATLANS